MTTISERQNLKENLEMLASQRVLYSKAKNFLGWQIFLTIFITIAISFFVLLCPKYYWFSVLSAILLVIYDIFITHHIEDIKIKASKIQELFDCSVLSLEWNEIISGDKPSIEDIKILSKNIDDKISIINWYPDEVKEVDVNIGRILCQRSNLWWDVSLKKNFIKNIMFFSIFVFLVILYFGLFNDFSLRNFIVNVLFPFLPFITFFLHQYKNSKKAINNLNSLFSTVKSILEGVLSGSYSNKELKEKSRSIQNEIFNYRKNNFLVFDWYYKKQLESKEEIMIDSAKDFIQKYNKN